MVRVLGTSAKLWMSLQTTFDFDKAMRRRKIAYLVNVTNGDGRTWKRTAKKSSPTAR
jgi:plasmid maintenance system antidote protein VapI